MKSVNIGGVWWLTKAAKLTMTASLWSQCVTQLLTTPTMKIWTRLKHPMHSSDAKSLRLCLYHSSDPTPKISKHHFDAIFNTFSINGQTHTLLQRWRCRNFGFEESQLLFTTNSLKYTHRLTAICLLLTSPLSISTQPTNWAVPGSSCRSCTEMIDQCHLLV